MPQAFLPFLPAIIGGVGSIFGAGSKKSTSENRPYYTPEQTGINSQLAAMLKQMLGEGGRVPSYLRNQGRKHLNETYNTMEARAQQNLTARGYGESGTSGEVINDLELNRANAFQDLEGQLQELTQARLQQIINTALNFGRPAGSTTTNTGPSNYGSAIGGFGAGLTGLLHLLGIGGRDDPTSRYPDTPS